MEPLGPEDLQVKLENLVVMACLAFPELLDPQVMLAMAHWVRKVFQGSPGLRVVQAALENLVLATSEHLASVESLENPEYLGYLGHQVYPD